MNKNETFLTALMGCLIPLIMYLVIFLIVVLPFSFWTDRNLDFYLTYFKGSEIDVPFWLSFLVTFFGNGLTFLLNIIGEIARLLIG
jgi:hypothetical protein